MKQKIFLIALFLAFSVISAAYAQSISAPDSGESVKEKIQKQDPLRDEFLNLSLQEQLVRKSRLRAPDITPQDMSTLFFSTWQYSLLQEARKGFRIPPPPVEEQQEEVEEEVIAKKTGIRELYLGGIVYASSGDWIIWLNGRRVTPKELPDHVMDIQVDKNFIEIKWFDVNTNSIVPVRLRPHQRFNLESRMFLPGKGNL